MNWHSISISETIAELKTDIKSGLSDAEARKRLARCGENTIEVKKKKPLIFSNQRFLFGGATRNRTGDKGFADLCLTAWLWRRIIMNGHRGVRSSDGADYGARTRHLDLGKVALYQMS